MADKKISALSSATTPLAGSEVLPIVQSGATVKVSVDNLTAGKDTSMKNLTYTGTLTGSTGIANIGSGQVYKDANGNVMLGNTAQIASSKFLVLNNETTANHVILASTRAYTDLPFARVQFAHKYDTGGTYVQFATVQGGKENANNADTAGYLSFSTFQNGGSLAERMRISSTGNITASTGNVVIGTAGRGIDFSANTNAAGMTSELLNWYEEGTWTPSLRGSSTAGTYELATASGWYTRIGRQVTAMFDIKLDAAITGGGTGFLCIAGLPFNAATTAATVGSCVLSGVGFSASAAYVVITPRSVGSPQIILQDIYANAGSGAVDVTTLAANDILQGTLTYLA